MISEILTALFAIGKEKRYNVEIQQENEGASVKRARYHSSLVDMDLLK